jgi:zinc protease
MTARGIASVLFSLLLITGCSNDAKSPDHGSAGAPQSTNVSDAPANTAAPSANSGDAPAPGAAPTSNPADAPASGAAPVADSRQDFGAESYRLVDQPNQIISVLKNGMTVIVQRMSSPVVSVRGQTMAGGIYESQWLGGGLSHLLEHLVAGGSNERRTEAQNRDLLQKIGNNSNADTSEDRTEYFINTTRDHLDEAVDLVSGWMLTAKITDAEFQREREVVQRELEMGEGEPDRQLYYMYRENRYRVSPVRVPVIGYQPVIKRLTRDDVYTYYKMGYQPNNMIFTVVGDIEPQKMLESVQKNVATAPPGRAFSHDIAAEPPMLTPRTVAATFPKLGQAHVMIGFPSVSQNSQDMYALDVLAGALGGGESSILVEELRDKQQLVSMIGAEDETPSYVAGTFIVMMEGDPEKIPQATEALLKIVEQVKEQGIDQERLQRAKMQIRAGMIRRRLTAEDLSSALAEDFRTTGDPNFSDQYVKRIEAVTAQQVQQIAKKYLDKNHLLTTALFDADWAGAKGMPKVEEILRPVSPATSQPSQAQPASPVVRTDLGNGTILLVKRISTSPTVVINMYGLGGVTTEDAKTNGLGNLTMSMLTRGTKTRNAQEIATFFDATGGEVGASCENNTWVWSANCLAGQFDKTMEAFADIVNNPTFPDAEFGPMKKRIEAAIRSEDADWMMQSMRYFRKEYFGPMNSPYQFTKLGSAENVQSFNAQQVRDWYAQKVTGGRRVLAIYGDVDPDKARDLAGKLLGSGGANTAAPPPTHEGATAVVNQPANAPADVHSIDVRRVQVQKTGQQLAGVVVGFKSDNVIGGPDTYDFTVAKTITGGFTYPTGYIFETLRGLGLVYVAYTQNLQGVRPNLPGTFFVLAGCQPDKVNDTVDQILLNMARVQGSEQDIVPDWFNRAKEMITTADAMDHETPAQQAATAALDELYGLGYAYHDQFDEKIRAVSLQQVQELARKRLRACVVTISTPKPEVVNVKPGVRTYDTFPPVDLTPRGVQHDVGQQK